ncbi:hypothetical protein [Albibacterium profundi]|uniref:NTP pyrophosphohydrolase MazG putative catalytic core domain-containing protein n=1 Tax=Albibacterium profundi TaxID=3134906 RepID=A0ABV5CEX4_9SPHI
MEREQEIKIMDAAVVIFGFDKQIDMLIEECSELIVECSKLKRGRINHIKEELADASIMIEQISRFFGEDEVLQIKEQKLLRLKDRIDASIDKWQ